MAFVYYQLYIQNSPGWHRSLSFYIFVFPPLQVAIDLVDHINSMPQYCCMPGCTNSGGHVFPSDPELRKKWRVTIKRLDEKLKNFWTPGKYDVVCTAHFRESDYKENAIRLEGNAKCGVSPRLKI